MPRHVPVTHTFPDFAGHLLDNGRLKLLDLLGSGAYGKVYRAVDLTSTCEKPDHYAVKCLLRPQPGSRHEDFQLREFQLHRLVSSHPNIVGFHKVLYDHAYVYVVLDLCLGGDLFAAITEQNITRQNDALIKSLFVQLLDAVHYCHQHGVFHRDLKPENILCSEDGRRIYLADFGLSTHKRVSKEFGCGSSYYMSPECIGKEFGNGEYSTRRSDIWSLGIILINMIAGRNPWRYATTADDCFSAFLYNGDVLRSVLPVSRQATRLLKRILRFNPSERITIPELRHEILLVETFFMSEEEILLSSDAVRSAVANYATPPPYLPSDVLQQPKTPIVKPPSKSTSSTMKDSEEVFLYASPASGLQPLRDHPHNSLLDAFTMESKDITSCSVSEPESAGPITPESRPVDEPLVEIPELSVDQLGGKFLDVITFHTVHPATKVGGSVHPHPKHRAPSNTAPKPPPRRVGKQLLKMAVQRLKGLSESVSS